ncbi:MAG: restriction endonuclease subunit R, partial [Romboutsia timonensis]|uniref:type I restriction endonuclease subunit R, EcoR124 family n=1 Tax=Romboutsia timonensis TaxID=1776391 RepID=UPI002A7D9661|nr:restriction endonuclease subunit R [Romboutsia timonensis]
SLKYHTLLQAFSRTNRIYEATKVWGNIVCYRNLKPETDETIKLFNDNSGVDDVLQRGFNSYLCEFKEALMKLYKVVGKPEDVDSLVKESDKEKFIISFKKLSQILLALRTFVDFEFDKSLIGIDEQTYEDFKSKYLLIYDDVKRNKTSGEKVSILEDIDFGIELMQTDRINVEYIMNLIRNIDRTNKEAQKKDMEYIFKELDRTDNPKLRKKVDLIKDFLIKQFPNIPPEENVDDAYNTYENNVRNGEIEEFSNKHNVDIDFVKDEISEYEFTGNIDKEKIINSIRMPYIKKRKLTNLVIDFIKENVFKYQS